MTPALRFLLVGAALASVTASVRLTTQQPRPERGGGRDVVADLSLPDVPAVGPALIGPEAALVSDPPVAVPGAAGTLPGPLASEVLRVDLPLIRDAATAYRRGDLAAGDALRDQVSDSDGRTLLDWVAIRFGGSAISYERVAAFAGKNPDWPSAGLLRRRGEEELLSERKPPDVVRAFFADSRPRTAYGKLALALVQKADGKEAAAAALVKDAWRNDSFGSDLESRMLDAFPDALSPGDHRVRMERQLFRENWDSARRAAALAGKGFDTLVRARVAVAGRAAGAQKLLDAVPAALKTDTSYLFSRAQLLRRQDKEAEAAKLIADVSRDPAVLVDGDEWWTERRLIARKLLDGGDAKLAYAIAVGNGASSPEKRIEAEFHAGWIALRFLHDPALASRHFGTADALAATPISKSRCAYWQGRAAEAAGKDEDARGFFAAAAREGTTYYGQLAAAKLGRVRVSFRPSVQAEPADGGAARHAPVTRIVTMLYAAGLKDVALPLVSDLAKTTNDVALLDAVGEVALSFGDARALLALGKGATQRGLALDQVAFPVIGVPSFDAVGERVEPAMVYAIARQESAFDPAAGSGVGARGLMQLMPATAQHVAKKYGVDFDAGRLLDGVYNARLGAAHLGELMGDWKGSYILTFASYNAGPGNVRKWITAYGDPRRPDVDPVDWVERIPFSETRNYVQRVMENLQVYRRRLDERSALLIESDLKRGGSPTQ